MLSYIIIMVTLIIGIWGWIKEDNTKKTLTIIAVSMMAIMAVLQGIDIYSSQKTIDRLKEDTLPPRLLFDSKEIQKVNDGYKVVIKFKQSKNIPIGWIGFHASIIDGSSSVIRKFWPKSIQPFAYKDDSPKISSDGKTAELYFQPLAIWWITLEIEVSAATKILIEGSNDLESIVIDIQ